MARKSKQITERRRSALKRPSFSSRLKPATLAVRKAANMPVFAWLERFSFKKKSLSTKKQLSSSGKKQTKIKQARQRQLFALPMGRSLRLIVALQRPKPPARKVKAKKATPGKRSSKKQQLIFPSVLIFAGLAGALFFGLQTVASPIEHPPQPSIKTHKTVPAPKVEKFLPRSNPVTLRIPSIELTNQLTTVGLTQDGTIEVPPDYTRAGWYRLGPTPGEKGPAIIVGHLDNIHGLAVFWRLQELTPGQTIEIDREDGTTAKFIIEKVKQVPQNENFPTEEVYGNTKNAALRLITCGGTFNHLTQHYSDNTVVFASLLPPETSKP